MDDQTRPLPATFGLCDILPKLTDEELRIIELEIEHLLKNGKIALKLFGETPPSKEKMIALLVDFIYHLFKVLEKYEMKSLSIRTF